MTVLRGIFPGILAPEDPLPKVQISQPRARFGAVHDQRGGRCTHRKDTGLPTNRVGGRHIRGGRKVLGCTRVGSTSFLASWDTKQRSWETFWVQNNGPGRSSGYKTTVLGGKRGTSEGFYPKSKTLGIYQKRQF